MCCIDFKASLLIDELCLHFLESRFINRTTCPAAVEKAAVTTLDRHAATPESEVTHEG